MSNVAEMTLAEVLPEWVKPGVAFRYSYPDVACGRKNVHDGRVFHVRGVVDERAVLREWSRAKQMWCYTVEDPLFFTTRAAHIVVS